MRSSVTRPPSRRSDRRLLSLGVVALAALTGCDTVTARLRAREGADLYRRGEYALAATKFEEAGRLDPKLSVLLLNAGTASLAHARAAGVGSPEGQAAAAKAIQRYQEYLARRPDEGRVKAALVQTFVEAGRYDDAVAYFRPRVDKPAPDIDALSTLATIAARCNQHEAAMAWHRRRIEAAPDRADGYVALGVHVWQWLHDHPSEPHEVRRSKADVALDALKRAIELSPGAPNAYVYMNLVYRELADSDPSPEGKKRMVDEASRYYKLALARQGKAS